MSKQYNIRWRNGEQDELKRLIKNYNEKVRYYTKKKNYDSSVLPQKLNYKKELEKIETRADFRRLMGDLKDFSKRGATDIIKSDRGAKVTTWEYNRIKRLEKRTNAQREFERRMILGSEVTTRGKGTGKTRAEMGNIKLGMFNKSNKNISNMSQKEWEYFKSQMEETLNLKNWENTKELMKVNYIKGLERQNYPQEVIDLVKQVPTDVFIKTFNLDEQAEIDFIYSPLEMQTKIEAIYDVWNTALSKVGL